MLERDFIRDPRLDRDFMKDPPKGFFSGEAGFFFGDKGVTLIMVLLDRCSILFASAIIWANTNGSSSAAGSSAFSVMSFSLLSSRIPLLSLGSEKSLCVGEGCFSSDLFLSEVLTRVFSSSDVWLSETGFSSLAAKMRFFLDFLHPSFGDNLP